MEYDVKVHIYQIPQKGTYFPLRENSSSFFLISLGDVRCAKREHLFTHNSCSFYLSLFLSLSVFRSLFLSLYIFRSIHLCFCSFFIYFFTNFILKHTEKYATLSNTSHTTLVHIKYTQIYST